MERQKVQQNKSASVPVVQPDITQSPQAQPLLAQPTAVGNQRALRRAGIQTKLALGPVNDRYEREADRAARQVVRRLPPGPQVQRRVDEETGDELLTQGIKPMSLAHLAQRQAAGGESVGGVPTAVERGIQQARGGGRPLPDNTRSHMENAFNADFSGVRVHTNPQADGLNRSLNAHAFTTGQNIFFRQGTYAPGSMGGQRLLAHELTHVVQQNGDGVRRKSADGPEVEQPIAGAPPSISTNAPPSVQRLVGFEFELRIPTFGQPGEGFLYKKGPTGQMPNMFAKRFLSSEVPYARGFTDEGIGYNTSFGLSADHDSDLNKVRERIIDKLKLMGYIRRSPPKIATSNLEYSTEPDDELARGAKTTINDKIDAITTHMNSIFTAKVKKKVFKIPDPGKTGYFTGVPVTSLKSWLGDEYSQIESLITEFQALVAKRVYPQATVGIMPSALPDLFESRVPGGDEDLTLKEKVFKGIDQRVKGLLAKNTFRDHVYIETLRTTKPIDYEAYKGLLYLLFSYMVGHAVNQTSGIKATEKNAVAFLIQMNVGEMVKFTPTTYLKANRTPNDLITIISKYFLASKLVKPKHWIDTAGLKACPDRDPFIKIPLKDWIPKSLKGLKAASAIPYEGGSGLPGDTLPQAVRDVSEQQKGVALEYRYIADRPNIAGVKALAWRVIDEVRNLNTKHMDDLDKAQLIDEANE